MKVGFQTLKEFENLNKKLLECIFCTSKKISKSIMAPMVSGTNKDNDLMKENRFLKNEKKIN